MSLRTPLGLLAAILVRIPLILKTVLLHTAQMSPASGKQDLRTELTVAVIRSFMGGNTALGKVQSRGLKDPGVKGPMWISKVTLPQPEDAVRDAVLRAIEDHKTGDETYDIPDTAAVEGEWTGYRAGVGKKTPEPDLSEEEKYHKMREESPSDMTILYFHGGAYFLLDPISHRAPVAHLSHLTGAPVFSVRYRLAPQNPFPAALVDALTAYLSLLHPPPGSLHKAIPANKIIFAGDSAGGNLALALLQTLLTLDRASHTIPFHGQEIPIELPAGVATISPWCDVTRSMPSIANNAYLDYLEAPQVPSDDPAVKVPLHQYPFAADEIWPSTPPRADIFCTASVMRHPLVSPLAAPAELWKKAPPVSISTGEEGLTDEDLILARRLHGAGVPVVAEMFEGMPHCHGIMFMDTPASHRFFEGFAGFCRDAVAGRVVATGNLKWIGFKLRETKEIPLEKACETTDEEVEARMERIAVWKLEGERELLKEYREKAKL
ncbi:Alpha/beta hydrolase fold-3 [Penicillium bovifimosum]|uniref:Alpha/beta hydrolase fold-3 n=1 Tax=Penicillium bovifimosum TaxID=126998 RepID=A0A9W9L3W6_9EURO|nr:Alpha/beta hydrolase fold-3 [Penicillium bovifimosum]KAJ5135586.1 Alpha/beta hydrolase fold-3 [Penicillium bovifimosum]